MTGSSVAQGFSPALAVACLGAALAVACAAKGTRVQPASASADANAISYSHVAAIFRESCEHCHNEDKAKGGLLLTSFDGLTAGGESGPAFLPGQGASSLMVQMLEGTLTPRMPYKEDPLPAEQVALIRRWIDAGAPGPAAVAPAKADAEITVPAVKPAVPVHGAAAAVAFDPSSRRLVVGGYKTAHVMALDGRTWTRRLDGHADLVRAVAFSADGRRLAVAGGPSGRFGEIKVWDVSGAEPTVVTTIRGHADTILAVAFAPDATTIASASYDRLVKVWDASTGAERATLKEHSDAVYALAFAPGGRHLLSAAGDRTIKIWDIHSGKRLLTINDPLDAIYSLAVHPSGDRIAAGGADKMIRTWSLNAGGATPTATLNGSIFAHADSVLGLAYAPDGSSLVSAGADRVIKIWDAATLREKQLLEPQPDWVLGLALSADGRWLAAGRYDGTVGLYGLAAGASGEHFVVPR